MMREILHKAAETPRPVYPRRPAIGAADFREMVERTVTKQNALPAKTVSEILTPPLRKRS